MQARLELGDCVTSNTADICACFSAHGANLVEHGRAGNHSLLGEAEAPEQAKLSSDCHHGFNKQDHVLLVHGASA